MTAEAVEDGIKSLNLRIEASEKRSRDAIADLRTMPSEATGRVYQGAPPASNGVNGGPPGSAMPNLDLPPFPTAASAPLPYQATQDPFAPAPPPSAFDTPPPPSFVADSPPPAYTNDPFAPPPTAQPFAGGSATGESYLSAARRAARTASMQADAERARGPMGAFNWGANRGADMTEKKPKRYGLIAGLALVATLAAVAGVMLSQKMAAGHNTTTPSNGIGSLFQARPQTSQTVTTTTATNQTSQNTPSAAPSSPTIAPNTSVPTTQNTTHPTVTRPPQTVKPQSGSTTAMHTQTPPAMPTQTPPPQTASVSPLQRLAQLANAGNANAETMLGLKYLEGDSVTQNDTEAAKWLSKAAAQGEAIAEYRLGTLYERGRGVPSDAAKAAHWYQQAATHGNRKAMHNLAVAFAEGAGVQKNYSEAARWFSKAASLGLADSQFNLAVLYERGLGVPQSLVDAYKWYAIAASQGDTESKSRIDALATQLSADERAAAQKAATGFRPQPLNRAANVPLDIGTQG